MIQRNGAETRTPEVASEKKKKNNARSSEKHILQQRSEWREKKKLDASIK